MNEEMREVISEFLVESNEGLDRLDSDLVELEVDPSSRDALGSIFRTMHTIKGTCGFLGFGRLEGISHAAENLLSLLRDGKLSVDREIIGALLASVDAIRAMLVGIEATGDELARHVVPIPPTNNKRNGDVSLIGEGRYLLAHDPKHNGLSLIDVATGRNMEDRVGPFRRINLHEHRRRAATPEAK